MPEPLVMLAYFAPMAAVFGLFWNVARKLGEIETDMRHVRKENDRLRADVQALRDLLSVILDQRRA
jgi:hypothetical protein